ncbi:MAG: hypothetical protein ACRDOJ_06645 [Nocardioidaceae bacterium]
MSVAATAEVTRLARVLRCEPAEIEFLCRFAPTELRSLRLAVCDRMYADHRATYSRIGAASRLLPMKVTAPLAQRMMAPRVSAGVVSSLPPEQAAAMAARMSTEYIADVATHLSPAAVSPVLSRMPAEVVLRVAEELHTRGDYDTMAEIVSSLTDDQVAAVLASVADPPMMVEVALRITDPEAVQRLTEVLTESHLHEMVRWARRRTRLWPELLALLGRLPQPQRRRVLGLSRG